MFRPYHETFIRCDDQLSHEGSYQLSHAYDRFLDVTADRHIKIQKNRVPASSDKGLVMRPKRQGN